MKFKKIAAVISAAAVALALTGCGNDPIDDLFYPQNGQQSGTTSSPFENKPAVQLPDIPVNDAAAFEYKFDSELGGMVITDYKLQSPKVHIPEKLENETVVKVDFSGVSKDITHIIMPDSVKEFDFSGTIKGAVQFVNIPASVTEIGANAFKNCTSLTTITIPDGVINIGDYAFSGCTGLTTIPDSVSYIGDYAFSGCTNLTTIPDSVTKIGEYAFDSCTGLTSITLPDSATTIGRGAFGNCTGLTSITIPDSVTKIGEYAFDGCTGLTSVIYNGKTYDNEHILWLYDAINLGESGMLIEDGVLKDVSRELTKVVIPDGVTSIGKLAFGGCTSLTSVTIPDSVTEIGANAFSFCTGLKSVTIPDSVTKINDKRVNQSDSFFLCENIKATYKNKTYDYEHIQELYDAINGN